MGASHGDRYQPICMLSHQLINKVTVVVGTCDLLQERIEQLAGNVDPDCAEKVAMIRKVSKEIVEQLAKHTCHVEAPTKAVVAESSAVILAKRN